MPKCWSKLRWINLIQDLIEQDWKFRPTGPKVLGSKFERNSSGLTRSKFGLRSSELKGFGLTSSKLIWPELRPSSPKLTESKFGRTSPKSNNSRIIF